MQNKYKYKKFSPDNANVKKGFGAEIREYCDRSNPFPISCALVRYRNSSGFPWKINHAFYESFFVINGECFIELEDETIKLNEGDFFVLAPETAYRSRAEFADVVIECTPPYDDNKVEVLDK